MDLYLVRHAIAFDRDPKAFPDDSLRPLSEKGIARARRGAQGLRKVVPTVELVLSSRYVRAWDTAVILHEEAGWPKPVEAPELEAPRPPSGALPLLEREVGSLALVGHEPFLSRFASLVITGNEDALVVDFKKGGVMALEVANGRGLLRFKLTPKVLRALAG
jgi:phosphohistidine phosphatase